MKRLLEYQIDDDIKMKELIPKVYNKLSLKSSMYIDPQDLQSFVEQNYDLLLSDVDSVLPEILLQNYLDFIKKSTITESIRRVLNESDAFLNELSKLSLK